MKPFLAAALVVLATLSSSARAQTAPDPGSTDPIVKMHEQISAAWSVYNRKVAAAKKVYDRQKAAAAKERDAAVDAARNGVPQNSAAQ